MRPEEKHKQLIVDLLREMDTGDLACIDRYYHPEYVEHGGSQSIGGSGLRDLRRAFAAFRSAFTGVHHTVEEILAEGDKVAARITFSGIFAKSLFGLPPTGQRVTATSIAIYRIVDGRIGEKWGCFDALKHLGVAENR